jgi:ABC-type transport system involved in cytochrome bd biosynthesis fused ATPase/permease subunit
MIQIIKLIFQEVKKNEKKFLIRMSIWQLMISLLEIIAILGSGFAGALAVSQITGQKNEKYINQLNIFSLSNSKFLFVLVLTSSFLLVTKTLLSIRINIKINSFLGNLTGRITTEKLEEINRVDFRWFKSQSPSQVSYFFGQGINGDYKNLLLGVYVLVNEFIFILAVIIFLAIINIILTVILLLILILTMLILHKFVSEKFKLYGQQGVTLVSKNNSLISDLVVSYKELIVANKIRNFQLGFSESRFAENKLEAKVQSLSQIPKFILEVLIVLVGLLLFAFAAIPSDVVYGSTTILIFGLAITRMAPSLLRAQNGLTLYKQNLERFYVTNDFYLNLKKHTKQISLNDLDLDSRYSHSKIRLSDVTFGHNNVKNLLENFNATFSRGTDNCIQGVSGVGKSTLAEIILGLLDPTSGLVQIDGINVATWRIYNPEKIYYLPQEPLLVDSTVIENITLQSVNSSSNRTKAEECLKLVGLDNFDLGDKVLRNKMSLSGGEKQKLGLARALYSSAEILILDEPTSSMDETSEANVFTLLSSIAHTKTVILITHSLNAKNHFKSITTL